MSLPKNRTNFLLIFNIFHRNKKTNAYQIIYSFQNCHYMSMRKKIIIFSHEVKIQIIKIIKVTNAKYKCQYRIYFKYYFFK